MPRLQFKVEISVQPYQKWCCNFGECKPIHSKLMKERKWLLGHTAVNELCEYKNLGVLKNYANSFSTIVEDNIEKNRKKAAIIFACNFDRRKTKLLIYIKFWSEVCLPSLLFGTKLFSLTTTQLNQLEHCQQWFLKRSSTYHNLHQQNCF